ncbi:Zinc finger imprinted 3 [Fukomys damarensis]|uniref:Zinc finger imprinted 3 n=1 Tax=Fukomys damarensis TaxID=885580 RepID=A0A091DDY5_FUKDA|nr:Zinc finger imprinted 3 [Fukomys damarensis]
MRDTRCLHSEGNFHQQHSDHSSLPIHSSFSSPSAPSFEDLGEREETLEDSQRSPRPSIPCLSLDVVGGVFGHNGHLKDTEAAAARQDDFTHVAVTFTPKEWSGGASSPHPGILWGRCSELGASSRKWACAHCAHCTEAFALRSDLVKQRRAHTGEKPHRSRRSHRTLHKPQADHDPRPLAHPGQEGRSRASCAAGPSSRRRTSRSTGCAAQRGEGPRPQLLQEAFFWKSNLRTHKKTHTEERAHACKQCGKCFIQKGGPGLREQSHTGQKPHRCAECGKAFAHKFYRTRHSR